MKQIYLLIHFLLFIGPVTQAQQPVATLKGRVLTAGNQPLLGATVFEKNTRTGAYSDSTGAFSLTVPAGRYVLQISMVGMTAVEKAGMAKSGAVVNLGTFLLTSTDKQLAEVIVSGKTEAQQLKETGFSVEAIDTRKIQSQTIDVNRLLDRTAGVRVRQSGGIGSDFTYSLNGLTGKAIKFFVDEIPMDYFGRAYSINNFPVSLIDRIDIYKGVVPVSLGSDALGGSINIVTRKTDQNVLEASYSVGSFNTHQAAVQGQWVQARTGLTLRLSSFLNKSDNNYRVWGQSVYYADASTGYRPLEFTRENPAVRFNDDFRTVNTKVDVGFTNRKWADQALVGVVASDLDQGVQTGQTMAYVYGKVRYAERFLMPYLTYKKENLGNRGIDLSLFSAYSMRQGITLDTSLSVYDWRGQIANTGTAGGEISAGRGRSRFELGENAFINRVNISYALRPNHRLGVNYLLNSVARTGKDDFQPPYNVAYLEPQSLQTQFAGVSYESKLLGGRLHSNLFAKWFGYAASVNEDVLTTGDNGEQKVIVRTTNNRQRNWGGGVATSFQLTDKLLPKLSIEQTTRLPDATEALGNGIAVTNNPNIRPEQSVNVNLGINLGPYRMGENSFRAGVSGFYRDTKDLLLLTVLDARGTAQYQNIEKVQGTGVELDVLYKFGDVLDLTANATYLDMRNNQEFDLTYANQRNIVYRDRLRNTPYLMANAGARARFGNPYHKGAEITAYLQMGYVHEYYLGWPSLGASGSRNIIPAQFVNDNGISYRFPARKLSLALDMQNVLDEQVFDNFLLQRPGRAIFFKIKYNLTFNN